MLPAYGSRIFPASAPPPPAGSAQDWTSKVLNREVSAAMFRVSPPRWQRLLAGIIGYGLLPSAVAPVDAAALTRMAHVNFVISGSVAAVEDGDTLTVQTATGDRFHIRLSDLDAPETAHAANPLAAHGAYGARKHRRSCPQAPALARGQAGGDAAAASLRQLAPLRAAARADCYEVDVYGRPVCHVFVGQVNVNLEQLRRGWAMAAHQARWIRDPASKPAEQAARAARVGIWRQPAPQAPARWRDQCWCKGLCTGAER